MAAPVASALAYLECTSCGTHYDADVVQHRCVCGKPLLARYDLERAARSFTADALAGREPSLWRYTELLPIRNPSARVTLGEMMTPIVDLPGLSARLGIAISLKDESLLPTASFKSRGAAIGLTRARELGVTSFGMPTNGNAGTSWAVYAARAKIAAHVGMPITAPAINRTIGALAGADTFLVDGYIGDAGAIVREAAAGGHLYDASTLNEPYRVEGKKTAGFELVEQFAYDPPDVVIYPTGGGVGLIGISKAFDELQALGLLGTRLPRLVAVQSTGCAPIVRAFETGASESVAWERPRTVAVGMTVAKALGDFLVLDALRRTNGTAIAVDDADLLAAQRELARDEGVFVCPEGAATLVAAAALRRNGFIRPGERVLVFNTGSMLKYPSLDTAAPRVLQPGEPLFDAVTA